MPTMNAERRLVAQPSAQVGLEKREDGKKTIVGYGSVFYRAGEAGTEYKLWDNVSERVDRHAFDRALTEKHNARGLYNHNPDNLLGTVESNTMRLSVDDIGLRYEIDLDPEDPDHMRVLRKVERGILTGSSFSFRPTKVEWVDEGDNELRVIKDLELYDTGPVTYPAYEASTVGTRSEAELVEARNEHSAWKDSQRLEAEKRDEAIAAEQAAAALAQEQSGSVVEEPVTRSEEAPVEPTTDPVVEPTNETPTAEADAEALRCKEEIAFKQRKLIASMWN